MADPYKSECREALAQIWTYLDGELTPGARLQIGRHLEECPPCGDMFGFESELKKLIAQRCTDEVPMALRTRIADALGLAPESPGRIDLGGPPRI
jgi:mycothiol system anti-sigma-R factor